MTYISSSIPDKTPRGKGPKRRSSATRKGPRWKTLSVQENVFVMIKEIALFRKQAASTILAQIVGAEFDKVYQESLLLMRIEESRKKQEKAREAQKRTAVTDRTGF
jgi:hypothetical protein